MLCLTKIKPKLCMSLAELKLIIIDEVSMVANTTLLNTDHAETKKKSLSHRTHNCLLLLVSLLLAICSINYHQYGKSMFLKVIKMMATIYVIHGMFLR